MEKQLRIDLNCFLSRIYDACYEIEGNTKELYKNCVSQFMKKKLLQIPSVLMIKLHFSWEAGILQENVPENLWESRF